MTGKKLSSVNFLMTTNFKCVIRMINCAPLRESDRAVFSSGAVFYAVQGVSEILQKF